MSEKQQAKILHDAWCVWMKNYFSLSEERRKAAYPSWQRLMNTPFDELTDQEAKSDYEVAEKVFPLKEPVEQVIKTYSNEAKAKYKELYHSLLRSGFTAADLMKMYADMQEKPISVISHNGSEPVARKTLELISLVYEFCKYNFLEEIAANKYDLENGDLVYTVKIIEI